MNLTIKKRIAFEIIMFFCAGTVALIIFLLSYPYNSYYNQKSIQTQSIITSRLYQLERIKNVKIPIGSYFKVTENDSLPLPDAKRSKERKRLIDQFENDIKSLTIEKENYKSKIIQYSERTDLTKNTFLLLLLIFFPIRYIYYLLIWSIKIVKQKE